MDHLPIYQDANSGICESNMDLLGGSGSFVDYFELVTNKLIYLSIVITVQVFATDYKIVTIHQMALLGKLNSSIVHYI